MRLVVMICTHYHVLYRLLYVEKIWSQEQKLTRQPLARSKDTENRFINDVKIISIPIQKFLHLWSWSKWWNGRYHVFQNQILFRLLIKITFHFLMLQLKKSLISMLCNRLFLNRMKMKKYTVNLAIRLMINPHYSLDEFF